MKEALSFVKDRQNGDGGFAASRGAASDIESVQYCARFLFAHIEVMPSILTCLLARRWMVLLKSHRT